LSKKSAPTLKASKSKIKQKHHKKERKKNEVGPQQTLPPPLPKHEVDLRVLDPVQDQYADHRHLEQARARWENGDWSSLLTMDLAVLEVDPDRARLALIIAAAHSHVGDMDQARQLARKAIQWGASRNIVTRLLLSAAQNSLARAAAALGEDATSHFEAALRMVQPHADVLLLARNRRIRELSSIGMLSQAAAAIEQELALIRAEPEQATSERFALFESQVTQLQEIAKQTQAARVEKKSAVWTVVIAGVPRSGSTWVYNVTRLLLEISARKIYACWQADYAPLQHEDADVHVVKVHSPDDLKFPYDLVLTTKRDTVDRVASLIRMGWVQKEADNVRKTIQHQEALYQFWKSRADIEVSFEAITKQPERAVQQIAHALKLPCTPKKAEDVLNRLSALKMPEEGAPHDPVTQLHPGHRSDGSETQRIADWIRSVL
jgi:tetratricopeptide (TPR) repeat protein